MEIFYIEIERFLKNCDLKSLENFLYGNLFKSEKRKVQFALGRFIVDFIGKNYYKIDPSVQIKNKKPYFINSTLHFSISHSKNIVLAAFDDNNIGVDIEFQKDRNFKEISKHLGNEKIKSKEDFYCFWCEKEATIKLQTKPIEIQNIKFHQFDKSNIGAESYILSLASVVSGIKSKLKIYELKSPIDNIIPIELINLKLVKLNSAKENTVVMQERKIANDAFFEPISLNIE